MTRLTDEQLMAYADGDPLGATPEIADRMHTGLTTEERSALDDFRRTQELVRLAYVEDAVEPPPTALVAMILGHRDAEDPVSDLGIAVADRRVDATAIKLRSALLRPAAGLGLAMAASVVALLAATLLWPMLRYRTDIAQDLVPGLVVTERALADALETQRSGQLVPTGRSSKGRDHLMVAGTFRDRNARICREFEVLDTDLVPHLAAVACRSPETGLWRVEGTAAVAHQEEGDEAKFAPAGAPKQEALAALMSLLGASEIMKPEEEQRLIDGSWK